MTAETVEQMEAWLSVQEDFLIESSVLDIVADLCEYFCIGEFFFDFTVVFAVVFFYTGVYCDKQ